MTGPVFGGEAGQCDPGVDAELLENVAEVAAGGVVGDAEALGDFAVGEATGDQPGDGELGVGQGRPALRGPLSGGQAALDPELAEAAADPAHVPACPAVGIDDQGAVEGGDGRVGAAGPDLGDGEVFEGRSQRELPLAGFEDADGPGQPAGVPGHQAAGVAGAGQHAGSTGVQLGPLLGGCRG